MREFRHLIPFKAGPHALDPVGVDRLALSENVFGASPQAIAAATAELGRVHLYPNSDTEPLRSDLARHYGVAPDWVLIGNGADELILLTILATCQPGALGVTTERTFAGYAASLEIANCKTSLVPLDASGPDLQTLLAAARAADISIVCNPHNPLGRALPSPDIQRIHRATVEGAGVLVLDEAYAEFASPQSFASGLTGITKTDNVVVLRTFSKAYGLAGLRCGYAVGHPRIISAMARLRTALPYNVNRMAIAAAAAALQDQNHLSHVVAKSVEAREKLSQGLFEHGIPCLPSETNFVLADVGPDTQWFVKRLVDHHAIQVRDAAPLGFEGHVRIGVCRSEEVDRVVGAIVEVQNGMLTTARSR